MENNARCPVCNGEFYSDNTAPSTVCPHCGNTVETVRALKYYAAFRGETAKTVLHGKQYFDYENLLSIGRDHLVSGEFDKAREVYESAVAMNGGDWRGYMGLVAVETKNYKDLKNLTHREYLRSAFAVADEAGKKQISEIYRPYSVKASMTEDEMREYEQERQKDLKARIKRAILGFSKVNEAGKKRAKVAFGIMVALAVIAPIMCVLGLVFNSVIAIVAGIAVALGAYGASIAVTKQRFNERLYELLAALFNGLKGFGLSAEQTETVLQAMSSILIAAREGRPALIIEKQLEALCGDAADIGNRELIDLLRGYKLTARYWKGFGQSGE